jgi:hypothetical protein
MALALALAEGVIAFVAYPHRGRHPYQVRRRHHDWARFTRLLGRRGTISRR